jgi:hypothetical protein
LLEGHRQDLRQDPKIRILGPGFLFSMWGERSLDAIRPSEGGFCQSSGHEKDENLFVGALGFKGDRLVLDRKVANFVEVYGRRRPVADIPKVTVTFGPPVVNGKAPDHPTAEAVYPKGVPDYADTVAKEGSLVVTFGNPVEDRAKRRVKLIEGQR